VIGIIRRFRDKGLPSPFNDDVLRRSGIVPESLIARTLQSLQILELIDDSGMPTPTLLKIRSVPEADYKACLAEWLRSVYSDVFAYVDPEKDSGVQVRDAFRAYVPHGQQDRMVTLFLALCAEAGITDGKKIEGPVVRKTTATRVVKSARPTPTISLTPKQQHVHPQNYGMPPALAGLLQSIPSPETGWVKADRDRFMATFNTVLDFCIPIKTATQIKQDAEEDAS
jgi:hypothetical protein